MARWPVVVDPGIVVLVDVVTTLWGATTTCMSRVVPLPSYATASISTPVGLSAALMNDTHSGEAGDEVQRWCVGRGLGCVEVVDEDWSG